MEPRPLIAVVTPVYNGGRYLRETMACVQAQTYPNLIHVVLDNASTDDTPAIIAEFADSGVPVLTARNASTIPPAYNWNAALRLVPSEAKYFRLLCADDLMVPSAIAKQADVAERHPSIGVVGCHYRAEGLCGEELPTDTTVFSGRDIMRRYLSRETMALSGMFSLIRLDFARRTEPFYDPSIVGFDTNAHLQVLTTSDYGFVHEELATWRRHEASITSRLRDYRLVNLAEWLILLDRYGVATFGADEYCRVRQAFRRHYLRRLLLLLKAPDTDLFHSHLAKLRQRGDPAGLLDFCDALVDWMRHALRGTRQYVGRAV